MLSFRILFMRLLVQLRFASEWQSFPQERTLAQMTTGSDPTERGLARSEVTAVLRRVDYRA